MTTNDVRTSSAESGGDTRSKHRRSSNLRDRTGKRAALFLWPCVLLLVLYIVYPILFSFGRSLFDASGDEFVGLDNYAKALTDGRTAIALKNNLIWVLVAPTIVTALGLLLAVLTEKIKWATAFRLVLFMPMAISLFASGVIFRLVYDQDPELGVANAAAVSVHDMFNKSSEYPGAGPRDPESLLESKQGLTTASQHSSGDVVAMPLVGYRASTLPEAAKQASVPTSEVGELRGVVWLDVSQGGVPGELGEGERGLPGITVQAVRDGNVAATATTGSDGSFILPDMAAGSYELRLPAENFAEPFRGLNWLGPDLVTPVIISAWVWIMTGFAMTFIAAGLAAIPRDALEAARVDGATESQVFRRVTVPLLAPVLLVVFVTLAINVLKIFDLVYVVAPGSSQAEANVLALQMWQVSFGAGGDQGMGSALAIVLLLLVVPAILFNIRRFRKASSG